MTLTIILAGLAILLFFIYFFYTGAGRSAYLLYVVLFLPLMDLGVTPAAFGSLTVFDMISFATVFLCYKDFTLILKKNTGYLYLFLIFIVLLFLGSLASEFATKSIISILNVIPPFIFIRLLLQELSDNKYFFEKFMLQLKIACLFAIGFILIQMLVGVEFSFYKELNQNVFDNGKIRYPGFFMDSQMSGLFLAMLSFLFLLNIKKANHPTGKNYLYFGFIIVAILLAGSRSAMLGFGAGLLFLIIFAGGNFRTTALVYGVFIGAVILYFADSFVLFKRFGGIDESINFRASIWDGALEIFKKNYVLGIGINNYQAYAKLHSQDQFLLVDNDEYMYLDSPENGYLTFLTEFGLFATIILFLLILSPVINVFYNFIKGKKVTVSFFFIAPVICWLLSFTSLYTLSDSRIIIVLCSYIAFNIAYASKPPATYET
jgi:O-antigen ligase